MGVNGSKNRPHDAYPIRRRVPVYYEPCRVCRLRKCRQLKKNAPRAGPEITSQGVEATMRHLITLQVRESERERVSGNSRAPRSPSFSGTLSVSLSICLCLSRSRSLSLRVSVCLSLALSLSLPLSLSFSVCLSISLGACHHAPPHHPSGVPRPPSRSRSLSHTLSLSLAFSLALSLALSLSVCFSLSLALPPGAPRILRFRAKSASGITSKRFKDFHLKAQARAWP